jgi:glycosyltransferase involved in cell wall biosynthesis
MAVGADALALDGTEMSDRNAAIWFSSDGFDPKAKGINGRRMAGESLLRGFFRNADVPEFVSVAHAQSDHEAFRAIAEQEGVTKPVRGVRLDDMARIAPVGTMLYSSPGIASETWRRSIHGATRYSICGITHTTCTKAVQQAFYDLRMAGQQEWDAVICTSRAVQDSVLKQMDLIDDHIRARFAGPPPRRPQFPILPLGINTREFARDPALGAALRERLGVAKDDVLCVIVARLSVNEKFDPLPLFLALAQAQQALGKTRLHLAMCGIFAGENSKKVTQEGAKALMPDVPLYLLDGANAEERLATLSGGDMFLFPIDNIQETFGLAPVEGMAAGLPVVATDWDGLRDTVTDDVGILVPTQMVRGELTTSTTQRYLGGTDNYQQYLSQISAVTRVHVGKMAQAIVTLAADPALRARLGAAGLKRATTQFDWAQVVPRMQALWGDLARIRRAADPVKHPPTPAWMVPVLPAPGHVYASYPTEIFAPGAQQWRATGRGQHDVKAMLTLRDYGATRRVFELPDHVANVLAALVQAGTASMPTLVKSTGFTARRVERCLMWLLKYDFVEEADD